MEYITSANDGVHHIVSFRYKRDLGDLRKIETSERYMRRNVRVMEYITQKSDTSEISVIFHIFLKQ